MGSMLAVAFIAVCSVAGIYTGLQPTVIKGEAMAARMLEQVAKKGITKITCDDRIPVTKTGAVFTCKFYGSDGSTARFKYDMNRAGALNASILDSTEPTLDRTRGGWDD